MLGDSYLGCVKVVFFSAALFSLVSCSEDKEVSLELPKVKVQKVIVKDVPIEAEWMATIEGNTNATIRAQVEGYLIKQNYKEGSFVKKGEVLFEIDPRPFQAALEKAQSEYKKAEAVWMAAKADLEKITPLAEINAVSKRDLDNAKGAEQSSSAQVTAAKAAVDAAQLNLDFTKVVAPIDGLAGVAKAQIGDLVGSIASAELTTVSSMDPVRVYIPITEQQYLKTVLDKEAATGKPNKERIKLKLILAGDVEYPETGLFAFADRQIDPNTGTLKVAALFPNKDHILRPGMYARVHAVVKTEKNSMLVPKKVISEVQGIFQIPVVESDGTVSVKTVVKGDTFEDMQIIKEGLQPEDRVIVDGVRNIAAGMKVEVVEDTEGAKAQ
ncbi:MAG: efflux RND transporter periplasmic adaptor subunit [Bdellovibrionota bacterium]|jgi:membrane fusion protein (multidrug efflux system)